MTVGDFSALRTDSGVQALLGDIGHELRAAHVSAQWQVVDDPYIAVGIVAKASPSTALALATSHAEGGPHGVSGAALGSVVAKVVRTSSCPVLVLPTAD